MVAADVAEFRNLYAAYATDIASDLSKALDALPTNPLLRTR